MFSNVLVLSNGMFLSFVFHLFMSYLYFLYPSIFSTFHFSVHHYMYENQRFFGFGCIFKKKETQLATEVKNVIKHRQILFHRAQRN